MGTNYYVRHPTCPCCGLRKEDEHIGKNSFGWKFLFAMNDITIGNTVGKIRSWKDWKAYLANKVIVDEYESVWTLEEFINLVEDSQIPENYCAETAPDNAYGVSKPNRFSHEFKDEEGYRFSTAPWFC